MSVAGLPIRAWSDGIQPAGPRGVPGHGMGVVDPKRQWTKASQPTRSVDFCHHSTAMCLFNCSAATAPAIQRISLKNLKFDLPQH